MTPLLTDRRGVIRTGLVGLTAAIALPSRAMAAPLPIEAYLFDRTLGAGLDPSPGVERLGFTDDVTALWFERIDPRWRKPGYVLAGTTTPPTLFLLEQLARSRHRRVVWRKPVEVAGMDAGSALHWVIAPAHPSLEG